MNWIGSENSDGPLIRNQFTKMTTGSSSVTSRELDLFVSKVCSASYTPNPAVAKPRVTTCCGPEAKQPKLQLDTEHLTDTLLFPS